MHGDDVGLLLEHRQYHRHSRRIDAVDDAARVRGARADGESLHFHRHRTPTLQGDRDARSRLGLAVTQEQGAGVGDLGDAVPGHVEASDLVRGPEAVLQCPDET